MGTRFLGRRRLDSRRTIGNHLALIEFALIVSIAFDAAAWCQPPTPKPIAECNVSPQPPAAIGQWAGPYLLSQIADEHPIAPLDEITHAVVLPGGLGVLLWCKMTALDPAAHAGLRGPTHTFVWRLETPSRVQKRDVPNPTSGAHDLFCGGHALGMDGLVYAFGGSDLTLPLFEGHAGAYRFDPSSLAWTAIPTMIKRRWYPNGFVCPDGFLRVLGHGFNPVESPTVQTQVDRLSFSSQAWSALLNKQYLGAQACDEATHSVFVSTYPRCVLLASTGKLFYPAEQSGSAGGTYQPGFNHLLDINSCPGSPTPDRWRSNTAINPNEHLDGSLVHYVTLDQADPPNAIDTVYWLGGENSSPFVTALNAVDKVTNPVEGMTFNTQPLDMLHAREDLNVVIAADGSMIALGGQNDDYTVTCVERYATPEVFGTDPITTGWTSLQTQLTPRVYHAVAGLLEDGRIFTAGGEGSNHTIDLLSPPYLFQGAPPMVSNLSSSTWPYDQTTFGPTFDVTFRQGVDYSRMHLIRYGSITHGFDAGQRFVELKHVSKTATGPNSYTIRIRTPRSSRVAPPGDYMLFVVDTAGVPSVGTHIRLQ